METVLFKHSSLCKHFSLFMSVRLLVSVRTLRLVSVYQKNSKDNVFPGMYGLTTISYHVYLAVDIGVFFRTHIVAAGVKLGSPDANLSTDLNHMDYDACWFPGP